MDALFLGVLNVVLAVTLGFFVENKREHIIEHQRSKVYATYMYDELSKDTASINQLIGTSLLISRKLDTLCSLIKGKKPNSVSNGMLYYYASYVTNVNYFSSNNATVEQLKGSGNLRIMKSEIAHKISEYDKKIRELEKEYGLSKSEFEKIENIHFKVFDVYLVETFFPRNNKSARDSVFTLNDLYVRQDPELLTEYAGWLKFESNIYSYQVDMYLEPIRKQAEQLLTLLKKDYKL